MYLKITVRERELSSADSFYTEAGGQCWTRLKSGGRSSIHLDHPLLPFPGHEQRVGTRLSALSYCSIMGWILMQMGRVNSGPSET